MKGKVVKQVKGKDGVRLRTPNSTGISIRKKKCGKGR